MKMIFSRIYPSYFKKIFAFFILFGFLALLAESINAQTMEWVEDSFEDFRDGSFQDGGRDMYISSKGAIKSVRRFDLNSDGYIDFMVNSSHNVTYSTPATICTFSNTQINNVNISTLPVEGSIDVGKYDLNNDGFLDLVFLPNKNGVSPRRYLNIFWGGNDGWVNHRKTRLVTMNAISLQIADLNQDNWPEIIILNGSKWSPMDGEEAVVRIYWGSEDTYGHYDATDLVVDRAVDLEVCDIDSDGRPDLSILLEKPGQILIYHNEDFDRKIDQENIKQQFIDLGVKVVSQLFVTKNSDSEATDYYVLGGKKVLLRGNPTTGTAIYNHSNIIYSKLGRNNDLKVQREMVIPPSTGFDLYDLDSDGNNDLILVNGENSEKSLSILWGNASEEYSENYSTNIPVSYISAVAFGDMNFDGIPDIAAGIGRTDESFEGDSYIIYGKGERQFQISPIQIPSSRVGKVEYIAENKTLIFCNGRIARLDEDIPIGVYWGTQDGFNQDKFTEYEFKAGYSGAGADLNDDGFTDMIAVSIVHASKEDHSLLGFNIFWGSKNGINGIDRTNVHEYGLWTVEIVDINKDGYLDLMGPIKTASPDGKEPTGLVIWYGSKDGFLESNRVMLPIDGGLNGSMTADYNKDGYLDVILSSGKTNKIHFLWGSESGLSLSNHTEWIFTTPADLEKADLNGDGWLDFLVTSHQLAGSLYWDFGTYIFWGSPDGFNQANAQCLPGDDGIGITIADWDDDGFLDVLLPNYHLPSTRKSVPAHLFWGSDSGFTNDNITDLMQDGGHDAMAVDFNHDGMKDLLIANHTRDGSHYTESTLYFNDGRRFKNPEIQFLPTTGPHYIYKDDIGNVYDRSLSQYYISSIHNLNISSDEGHLDYSAFVPNKTKLTFFVRSAPSEKELLLKEWVSVEDTNQKFEINTEDKFIQYKALFISDNGDRYPELDKVSIKFK